MISSKSLPPVLGIAIAVFGSSGGAFAGEAKAEKKKKESPMSAAELVKPSGKMKLTSPAFKEGEAIPLKHTKYDKNISPALEWTGAPAETKGFALLCTDPDAMKVAGKEWVHWVLVDLPAEAKGLAEGEKKLPAGAKQLKTDFGDETYGGPRPPAGTGVHHYVFALYALKEKSLPVKSGAPLAQIRAAIKKLALDQAILAGTYEKK